MALNSSRRRVSSKDTKLLGPMLIKEPRELLRGSVNRIASRDIVLSRGLYLAFNTILALQYFIFQLIKQRCIL